jgi:hypothetical protein
MHPRDQQAHLARHMSNTAWQACKLRRTHKGVSKSIVDCRHRVLALLQGELVHKHLQHRVVPAELLPQDVHESRLLLSRMADEHLGQLARGGFKGGALGNAPGIPACTAR